MREKSRSRKSTRNLNKLRSRKKNFSNSGLLFESPISIEIGTQVQIQIADKSIGRSITVIAQVVRLEKFDSYCDIGVSFVEIDDTSGSEIAQTLANNLGIPVNSLSQKKNPEN